MKNILPVFMSILIALNVYSANYYVNDSNTAGDRYCTAIGDDLNNGQTPNTPKQTFTAVS